MTIDGQIERSALVDFHCHLDLYPNHQDIIAQCEQDAVYTLAVTTTPKAWARNHELSSRTKYVRAALGLHPQLVASRASELSLWEELLSETRYVGEVGLDSGPQYFKSIDLQKDVFARILDRCAEIGDRILTIHSVRAVKIVLDMLEARLPRTRGRTVLHWFTGSAVELRRAIDLGCFFSVNHAMLSGDKRRALVEAIPRDRILTETDGPFTQTGSRPSVPGDVSAAVEILASLAGTDSPTMARQITSNLRALVG